MYDHLMYIVVNATPFKLRYNNSQMTGIQSTEALQYSNTPINAVCWSYPMYLRYLILSHRLMAPLGIAMEIVFEMRTVWVH